VKARNFAGALAVSLLLAVPFIVPFVAGVATWKIVLGVAGLLLFVTAGMTSRPRP